MKAKNFFGRSSFFWLILNSFSSTQFSFGRKLEILIVQSAEPLTRNSLLDLTEATKEEWRLCTALHSKLLLSYILTVLSLPPLTIFLSSMHTVLTENLCSRSVLRLFSDLKSHIFIVESYEVEAKVFPSLAKHVTHSLCSFQVKTLCLCFYFPFK